MDSLCQNLQIFYTQCYIFEAEYFWWFSFWWSWRWGVEVSWWFLSHFSILLFFVRIDLRVGEIDSKVNVVLVKVHIVLDLLRRGTWLVRICCVIAGWNHSYVFRVLFWWVFTVNLYCSVQRRTQPLPSVEFIKTVHNLRIIFEVLFRTGL